MVAAIAAAPLQLPGSGPSTITYSISEAAHSSELKSPELESKLLARIKQFEFGARDVDQIDITYPLDFLPS